MPFLDISAFSSAYGVNLEETKHFAILQKVCQLPELIARHSSQVFTLFSLAPATLLYVSEYYQAYTGFKGHIQAGMSLNTWLGDLDNQLGLPLSQKLMPMLDCLHAVALHPIRPKPFVVFTYCMPGAKGEQVLYHQQICKLPLYQAKPEMVFLSVVQCLDYIKPSFSHEVKLIDNSTVLLIDRLAPPLKKHPLLQNLSPAEWKVLNSIYQSGEVERDVSPLLMAEGTIKSHRKHIIKKTGLPNIEALVTILRMDMGTII